MLDDEKNLEQQNDVNDKKDDINEDIINSEDAGIPPLSINISENPEEIREMVSQNLKEAEKIIKEEMYDFDSEEDYKDNIISKIKLQNNLLKICCICLFVCTIINMFMTLNRDDSFTVKIDDSNISNSILGEQKLSASQIYNENINSVVAIHARVVIPTTIGEYSTLSSGSGFVISEDGYILTNYHVIENYESIEVIFSDGRVYEAELVGDETDKDVAVLKINSPNKFTPIVFDKSKDLIIGEDVVAIGNPLGELTFSITKGIVSAVDRNINVDTFNSIEMFQVDCAVNQGNSGGPLFNMSGKVVGIVSAKYASDMIEGLGFCIPIDDIVEILPDLIKYGKVPTKAQMGITVTDVTQEMIDNDNLTLGAYIASIEPGSCAETAGLKVGDVIISIGDINVLGVRDLLNVKKTYKAGDTVFVNVWRNGMTVVLSLTFDSPVKDTPAS